MDFGTLLRELMREQEMTGRGLARRVPCDPALISRLAHGRRPPSARIASRLDDLLGAGGALAAAAERWSEADSQVPDCWPAPAGDVEDDEMDRRELLGAMMAGPFALELERI